MVTLLICVLFISLASICNAIMDVVTHHFSLSIFSDFSNKIWWDGENSWKNKYIDGDFEKGRVKWNILGFKINKPVQITDAWHFFKTLMIIFMCLASVTPFVLGIPDWAWYYYILVYLLMGTAWNVMFSLFYDKIFKK